MRTGLVLAGCLLIAALCAVASPFLYGPYTGAPSADAVTVSWRANESLPARIEYGLRADFRSAGELPYVIEIPLPEEGDATDTAHVVLDSLEQGRDYVYRVVLSGDASETTSAMGSFCTEPPAGSPVEFAVLSDTQQQLEGVNRLELVGDAIALDDCGFDFILHAGDVVESPVGPYWDDWLASFDQMLLRAPFIPVLGNHERNDRSYYETFDLPPGEGLHSERWWALHWGDVVVVGLDTNVRKPTDYFAQQAWAAEHLSGPEPHKFAIFHHPVFSSDEFYGTGYQYDTIYHPIFVEHEVDIVFNGHSHHYEHIVRDGVTYMVVGGGGATPRKTTPIHIQGSDVSVEGHHFYVRVETSAETIEVTCVSVAQEAGIEPRLTPGEVLDHFVLPTDAVISRDEARTTAVPLLVWIALGVLAIALLAVLTRAR